MGKTARGTHQRVLAKALLAAVLCALAPPALGTVPYLGRLVVLPEHPVEHAERRGGVAGVDVPLSKKRGLISLSVAVVDLIKRDGWGRASHPNPMHRCRR